MASLYELTGKWLEVYEMAGEVEPEVIDDTLESIEGEIESKAIGYGMVIKQLEADASALAEEIKRLQAKKKAAENTVDRMKARLQESMNVIGTKKITTPLFSFGIQKNPPKVVIDDPSKIYDGFLIPQEPKIDTAAIKEALKNEDEAPLWKGIAHLEQGESLRIR